MLCICKTGTRRSFDNLFIEASKNTVGGGVGLAETMCYACAKQVFGEV